MPSEHLGVMAKINVAFKQVFPNAPFDESASMDTMGDWTSMRQVQLLSALEKLFDVEFNPSHVATLRSVRLLAEFLADEQA